MELERRDFLKGGLAAFTTLMLPFRVEASPDTTVDAEELTPFEKAMAPSPRVCHLLPHVALCRPGKPSHLLGNRITIDLPQDERCLSREPLIVKIDTLTGSAQDVEELINIFSDITHTEKLTLALLLENSQLKEAREKYNAYLRSLQIGGTGATFEVTNCVWVIDRPILTSIGVCYSTPKRRIDAYGGNNGKDIITDDKDRVSIVSDIQFHCMSSPVLQEKEQLMSHFLLPVPYSKANENHVTRNKTIDWEAVDQYAREGHSEENVWEKAGIDLKDPDTYPAYQGGSRHLDKRK